MADRGYTGERAGYLLRRKPDGKDVTRFTTACSGSAGCTLIIVAGREKFRITF